jgi:hypothetical protein
MMDTTVIHHDDGVGGRKRIHLIEQAVYEISKRRLIKRTLYYVNTEYAVE